MPSVADTRMAAFIAAGYTTGSLADRSMKHLISKGATTGSLADRQKALGKKNDPRGHIDVTQYP